MATTTPNYGWTVPTSTDLVKDGATAIETLGDAIDASMNTALGTKKAGMVLLNTTSFSGVSSVSLPANTFTGNYQNYKILFTITSATATATVSFRLRASGADDSSANYFRLGVENDEANAVTGLRSLSQTSLVLDSLNTGVPQRYGVALDILKPQLGETTLFSGLLNSQNAGSAKFSYIGGFFAPATTFDSCSFIVNSGNFSGRLNTYGYNL